MAIRMIQWATGGVGRAAIEAVLEHPELELAGAWVHSETKEGVDLGTLVGRGPIGVTATNDFDALLALDADCVVYSPFMADPKVVERILRSGNDVVTPLGWFYPPADQRARGAPEPNGPFAMSAACSPGPQRICCTRPSEPQVRSAVSTSTSRRRARA